LVHALSTPKANVDLDLLWLFDLQSLFSLLDSNSDADILSESRGEQDFENKKVAL
jgi:hypothetical protein